MTNQQLQKKKNSCSLGSFNLIFTHTQYRAFPLLCLCLTFTIPALEDHFFTSGPFHNCRSQCRLFYGAYGYTLLRSYWLGRIPDCWKALTQHVTFIWIALTPGHYLNAFSFVTYELTLVLLWVKQRGSLRLDFGAYEYIKDDWFG